MYPQHLGAPRWVTATQSQLHTCGSRQAGFGMDPGSRREAPPGETPHRSLPVLTFLRSGRYQHFTCNLNEERKKLRAQTEFSFFHLTYFASWRRGGVESFIRSFTHLFHEYSPSSHSAPGLWGPWLCVGGGGFLSDRIEFPHRQRQGR